MEGAAKGLMSRVELQGWIQIAIGLVGLWLTLNNAGTALDAISALGAGTNLPPEFRGVQGAIRVFFVILVMAFLLALFLMGLAIVLGGLFRHLGAASPLHSAATFVAGILSITVALTLAVFGSAVWIPISMIALLCVVCAGIAAVDTDGGVFWLCLICGLAGAIFIGSMIAGLQTGAIPANQEQGPEAATKAAEQTTEAAEGTAAARP